MPWYVLAQHAPAWVVIFYLGALHGVTAWLAAAVAWTALAGAQVLRLPLAILTTLSGLMSPGVLTELGTTFGNLPTAALVLGSLLVGLRGSHAGLSPSRACVMGLLLGAAVGLKLTNLIWLAASLAAVAVLDRDGLKPALRRVLSLLAGSVLGALATGGYWWLTMWRRFDNPVFPFYNGIFHSDYGWQANFHDDRFRVGPLDALTMPVRMALGLLPSENPGRDIRWTVVAELALVALVLWRLRAETVSEQTRWVLPRHARFICAFAIVGWTTWLVQFGIQRYLIALELMSGLLIVTLIDLVLRAPKWRVVAVSTVPVIVGALVIVPAWPHKAWGESWFEFRTPGLARQDNLLVVLPKTYLLGHALAAMPDGTVAVTTPEIFKIGRKKNPLRYSTLADDEVRSKIARHDGPIVGLTYWQDEPFMAAQQIAEGYGLGFTRKDCEGMSSSLGRFAVCRWSAM